MKGDDQKVQWEFYETPANRTRVNFGDVAFSAVGPLKHSVDGPQTVLTCHTADSKTSRRRFYRGSTGTR